MELRNGLLPTFEPTEQDLIDIAMNVPLEQKIKKAVALLQQFEGKAIVLSDYGFHVCDSYGKDSNCIVKLAELAGVCHECHHNFTTIDPPELIRFGRVHRPDTIINRPEKHLILERMVEKAKPPTRLARWCCSEYKEHGGNGKVKVIGVRAAESARRMGLWKTVNINNRGGLIIAPIVYWTDADVWEFHRLYDLPYCSLYDEGFKRLGCVGCPLAGPVGQTRAFARWPGYERLWRRGFQLMWDRWHGIPNRKGEPRFFEKFGSADGFYEWWRTGEASAGEDVQCVFEEMMENR